MQYTATVKEENKEIANRYKDLLKGTYEVLSKKDKELIRKAFDIAVDAHSNQYLDGSVVAYTKTLMAEQFQIKNPTASSSCGCGSSFAV